MIVAFLFIGAKCEKKQYVELITIQVKGLKRFCATLKVRMAFVAYSMRRTLITDKKEISYIRVPWHDLIG